MSFLFLAKLGPIVDSPDQAAGSALDGLLRSFETDGESEGEGSFSLDPRRALTMLASQGRLSGTGPLFLLSAIYQHCEGSPLVRRRITGGEEIAWPERYGPLPETVETILANEAFLSRQLKVEYGTNSVKLRIADRFKLGAHERIAEQFAGVSDRLTYYPWADQKETPQDHAAQELLNAVKARGGRLLLREPRGRATICWVVHGIAYRENWALPVDGAVFDELLRPDLSLSVIPESSRKAEWLEEAEQLLLKSLRQNLARESEFRLTVAETSPGDDPMFLRYLPFVLRQSHDPELASQARAQVKLPDVYGRYWSLGQLEQSYQKHGRLLSVSSIPEELPGKSADRPILEWSGQARRLGEQVLPQTYSGAGYLYSLRQNERDKLRVEQEATLGSVPLEDGQLSLLAWAEEDRPAEVVMVGKRRAAETFYLDDRAPRGLRLLWDCEREVGEHSPESMFGTELRVKVLELLDQSLAYEALLPERLVVSLLWALAPGAPLAPEWQALQGAPLLPDVRGVLLSYRRLRDLEAMDGGLPTLEDLSTSLPEELPAETILWWHPLLEHLSFQCREMGREVREAHWKEEGRARWLERFTPTEPSLSGVEQVLELDGHLVGWSGGTTTEITLWREGRPLGKRRVGPAQCPPGYSVVWVDDEFPADRYWGGPDTTALVELYSELDALCRRAAKQLGS